MSNIDSVDRITADTLTELASLSGPWVTITMPTHRSGPQVLQGPLRLRNLAAQALDLLTKHADDPQLAEQLAGQFDALRSNNDFWQRQGEGLVVLGATHGMRTFRTSEELPEAVRVDEMPGLRELALRLDADEPWYVVAVSQNKLRLLQATGQSVTELPLEDIPASSEDALGDIDRQKYLQWSAQGGGTAQFHGHGADAKADRVWLEKYLRRVVAGLDAHSARPGSAKVVLAGVAPVVAALRSMWKAPGILDDSVDGNPDRLSPAELHAAAQPLIAAEREQSEAAVVERLGAAAARGLDHPEEILRAAAEGRVAELFIGQSLNGQDPAPVDAAIRDTLTHGGDVVPVRNLDVPMAALTRY